MSTGATTTAPLLTDDHLKTAVTLFAEGKSRMEVVEHLIDTDKRLDALAFDDSIREKIADALRAADPTSQKFAVTKYGEDYKLKREAIKIALANRYELMLTSSVDLMLEETKDLRAKREELDHMLEAAREQNPVGTSEYLATMNARNAISKRLTEIGDKLLERLERLKTQTDNF